LKGETFLPNFFLAIACHESSSFANPSADMDAICVADMRERERERERKRHDDGFKYLKPNPEKKCYKSCQKNQRKYVLISVQAQNQMVSST
jgi:hypothetical protein